MLILIPIDMKSTGRIPINKLPNIKNPPSALFPIVAIGASAGGLEAVTQLLQYLPAKTGMAFIYVQHLSPDYKSILATILSKSTLMKVQEVKDMVLMKPDNIYVIPPDKNMLILNSRIKLVPHKKDTSGGNVTIDTFFKSLAEKHKERVIGIILSGSASDGTLGLKAIKLAGGLTFAQDETAKFGSMPKSAISSGVVDFILSPKNIAQELFRISRHPLIKFRKGKLRKEDEIENHDPDLKAIFSSLKKQTAVDFSLYKPATIKRRILRRMLLYSLKSLKEYAKLLEQKPTEIDILYQDLLINVTSFFRDSDTHLYLKTTLFPRLLKNKPSGETIRIWVPACSTGEEAYSIAMTLLEIQSTTSSNTPIQIFATDLSNQAIHKARIGEYGKNEIDLLSPKRIQRFYTKSATGYRIIKAVRDMCVFASHNILADPPFSRVDFISCCNLFIYLDIPAQHKALLTFHYALNDKGFLMLGKSETISAGVHLFNIINNKHKIYSPKKITRTQKTPETKTPYSLVRRREPNKPTLPNEKEPPILNELDHTINSILLSKYVPASVVVNHELETIQFRGTTSLFLEHPPGKASLNILKMTRPEIAFELRQAISKVIKTKQIVRKTGIEVKIKDNKYLTSLEVVPIRTDWGEPLLLIVFTEQEHIVNINPHGKGSKGNFKTRDLRIKRLEAELASARTYLDSITQKQETFNAELQSANEEVVSSNEELQSVNEELETSKEEIESTNEELITTNQELQTRNELLAESYNYSEAIISTIHEPMLILDKDLRIKSANKSFYKKFKTEKEKTEGVLLYELNNRQWNTSSLRLLFENILLKNTSLINFEIKLQGPDQSERIFLLNANFILQESHQEQLILLAIEDITDQVLPQIKENALLQNDILENRAVMAKERVSNEQNLENINKILQGKNDELERMNHELEAFVYISSHDLQEPLRKIQTFASRLKEKEINNLSDNGKNYFNRMQDAAKRMQTLIEDLLLYSHTSTTERIFTIVDLSKIVNEVKKGLRDTILEKNAVIDSANLGKIWVNHFQFRQLLFNLISNSLKFSNPKKKPHIQIKSEITDGSKLNNKQLSPNVKYFHISFSDNGIGFEPHLNKRIFEVFQKLHSKDEYPGTGIGLAIVKKIVENHNGFITAKGALNKGAVFDIYIPSTKDKLSEVKSI